MVSWAGRYWCCLREQEGEAGLQRSSNIACQQTSGAQMQAIGLLLLRGCRASWMAPNSASGCDLPQTPAGLSVACLFSLMVQRSGSSSALLLPGAMHAAEDFPQHMQATWLRLLRGMLGNLDDPWQQQ